MSRWLPQGKPISLELKSVLSLTASALNTALTDIQADWQLCPSLRLSLVPFANPVSPSEPRLWPSDGGFYST